jgi:hypothetical protein
MAKYYNEKVAVVSGLSSGVLHIWAHMHFANWTLQRGIESNVTWIMAVSALVFTWLLLSEKDNYHENN